MKKILLSFSLVYCVFGIQAFAASSPVVQVVSYKEPLGLYFALQGWGSGSIIDQQGHIITNNHVVDDGQGGISDDFTICMTDDPALPPRCYYTASVINRDADADVAVLRLDSVDIFGKKVDFETLSVMPMDMNYSPQSGDTTVARGYPWIGANTITETQGIISGTAQYNGNTYIKTDALIAGGNSGGPLIRDGKMIGVNTFLVGGGYDPSLAYSLLVSEADDFIREAISRETGLQKNNPKFPAFLKEIETFSSQKRIVDPLISVNLPEKYTISSYIPAMSFSASLTESDPTSVSSLSFHHIRTPKIVDLPALQKYLTLELMIQDIELKPVTLGGKSFYELSFDEEFSENDKTKNAYIYLSIVDETHLLLLLLETPVPTKNTLIGIQKSVKEFLGNITFPATFIFPEISNITIPGSDISIAVRPNSSISYDIGEYEGLLSYSINNRADFVMVRNYLGNFWSKAQISIFKNSFETEDDSIDTWIKNTTESIYETPVIKKKVNYQGYQGFLVCYEEMIRDESSKNFESIDCEVVVFLGNQGEYILSAQMILAKNQLKRIDTLMQQYLSKAITILNIGETNFNTEKNTISLPYSDVSNQSRDFQEALRTLIAYGILQSRPSFEGDAPLRWREYFSLYIWSVYHKKMTDLVDSEDSGDMTFEKALSVLPISMDEYAGNDEWQLGKIHSLIRLIAAGGSLPRYDFDTIYDFSMAEYEGEGAYQDAWSTINTFESMYFSDRNTMKRVKYTSDYLVTYNPFTDLTIQSKNTSKNINFFRNNKEQKTEAEKFIQCDKGANTYFSTQCRDMRKASLLESLTYPVLTKGRAIEVILGNIDISLWTPQSE